jgi:hypothetical protein
MPVLPQVHDGHYHELLLTREVNGTLLALRLWRSPYQISDSRQRLQTLWLGNITTLRAETRGGLTVPRTQPGFAEALEAFTQTLQTLPAITLHHSSARGPAVLLLSLRAE